MRLIDADALKVDYIVGSTTTNTECYRYVSLKQIVNAPTADVVERKKGKWETTRPDAPMFGFYYCSLCGRKRTSPQDHFCPNCGADMRKENRWTI